MVDAETTRAAGLLLLIRKKSFSFGVITVVKFVARETFQFFVLRFVVFSSSRLFHSDSGASASA